MQGDKIYVWLWRTLDRAKTVERNGQHLLVVDNVPAELETELRSKNIVRRSDETNDYEIGNWSWVVRRTPFNLPVSELEDAQLARYSARQQELFSFTFDKCARLAGVKSLTAEQRELIFNSFQQHPAGDVERATEQFLSIDDQTIYSPIEFFRALVARQVRRSQALVASETENTQKSAQKPPDLTDLEGHSGRIQSRISVWTAQNPGATPEQMIEVIQRIEREYGR